MNKIVFLKNFLLQVGKIDINLKFLLERVHKCLRCHFIALYHRFKKNINKKIMDHKL